MSYQLPAISEGLKRSTGVRSLRQMGGAGSILTGSGGIENDGYVRVQPECAGRKRLVDRIFDRASDDRRAAQPCERWCHSSRRRPGQARFARRLRRLWTRPPGRESQRLRERAGACMLMPAPRAIVDAMRDRGASRFEDRSQPRATWSRSDRRFGTIRQAIERQGRGRRRCLARSRRDGRRLLRVTARCR